MDYYVKLKSGVNRASFEDFLIQSNIQSRLVFPGEPETSHLHNIFNVQVDQNQIGLINARVEVDYVEPAKAMGLTTEPNSNLHHFITKED